MAKAHLDGEIAALNTGGWCGRSVVIGAVTGVIDTTITYAVAATSTPELPAEKKLAIASQSPDLQAKSQRGQQLRRGGQGPRTIHRERESRARA
jgi:hypothetical protein